jgi:DNA-binding response OmpR family regulator
VTARARQATAENAQSAHAPPDFEEVRLSYHGTGTGDMSVEIARIRTGQFQVGEWTVEPEFGRLSRGEDVVHLEPRVMDLLVFLAGRPGEVVGTQQILDHV